MERVEACERGIAALVRQVDGLRQALRRVAALHVPARLSPAVCHECGRVWPCETSEVARDAL